jgi:translocation and assembly module TamB
VNTLLTGDLKVTNEVANPNIFGKLKSVRGRYQEFGKSLTVRDGVLSFDGPLDPSPFLNIVGFTVVDGVEIRLILAGSIFKPDIKIESTPYLTQENALSLLLFGKNPDKISEVQALSLADGVRRISGHGGGFDPLGLGRKILGVDDINFEDNEDTATKSVRVGKYLTDKVYLEVEQGDQVSGTKTRIEVEITPKISIEANTGNRGNSAVGINWRFDY